MNKTKPNIRILIADDHKIVRCGLKSLLDNQDDLEVIGEASSCTETLNLTSTLKPDVLLLDLTLSDGSCIDDIPELLTRCPNCKILLFTASPDIDTHLQAIHYGVAGVLLKGDAYASELITKAIRHVFSNNELWVDESLSAKILKLNTLATHLFEEQDSAPLNSPCSTESLNALTPRENQIACLSAKGLSAKQIGKTLFISEKTVRNQRTIIYSKLNVKNQLELAINSNFMNACSE